MERKQAKPNPAPPLLCWDIYATWLYEKIGYPQEKAKKLSKKEKL